MPSASPLVSVVVPTYRRPHFLSAAIESVLAQTYQSFELLVSDDDVCGDTRAVVESFDDPRVSYRANEERLGQGLNPLLPLSEARGDLVACLHDDDQWAPELLSTLVPPLVADPELVVAFGDHSVMNEAGVVDGAGSNRLSQHWGRAQLAPGKHLPFARLALVGQSVPMMISAVARRTAIDWELSSSVGRAADLWFGYLAARTGRGAYYIPERLASYRLHGSSSTARGGADRLRSQIYCYERCAADPGLASLHREFAKKLRERYAGLGIALLRAGERREARRPLRQAFRGRTATRAAVGLALSVSPLTLLRR